MKIKKIKIGNADYVVSEEATSFKEDVLCQIRYREYKILLEENTPDDKKLDTLLHEITHGLLHFFGRYNESNNEGLVSNIADGMIMVLRDNPELLDLVNERCKSKEK